jgi:hypothetical protein
MKLDLNKMLAIAGVVAGVFLITFLLWWQWGSNIISIKNEEQRPRASLTGLVCNNYARRPIAVMMASDPVARPLSGIGQADIVVEMPVTPDGVTRMMAVFQCEEPEEIGSIRSARKDFLTLVDDFNALYVHWGGEREALNKLNNDILNNIDAMKYEGTVFYRKSSIPRPHNGFTTIELLTAKAENLGYEMKDTFAGYLRHGEGPRLGGVSVEEEKPERNLNNIVSVISVDYENPYDVRWTYDSNLNTYKRARGGEAEIDANTGKQVETNIVVLIHTVSKVLNIDYITVNTVGEGPAEFYQNGIIISGTWKNIANDLKFYDINDQEMKFVPGKMWIEIITK